MDAEGRCGLCRSGLRGFDAAYSFGSYDGPLRQLIHLFKYGRIQTLARPLADLLLKALPRDEQFDGIVAVPLHLRRRWQRGFNQADLLARLMSRHTGIPLIPALRRERFTAAQAGLSNSGRRRNVTGAFACRRGRAGRRIQGRRLLLIDDVMTTGSTAAACAAVLKSGGAARVVLLTVARADRRMDGRLPARNSRKRVG